MDIQRAAIQGYAQRHGLVVIRTYADPGKSGVGLKERPGLRQLLHDVVTGTATFHAVLVHDVTRWGRFQDADEAAHYEFLCKQGRAPVHYCGEMFMNDTSPLLSVLKSLKRSMAGEYSRELSVKCFEGQKRLAQLGFRMGAPAGYGLRRMVVSADRKHGMILGNGEYKNLLTDRIVLVPGPKGEVNCVREIYAMVLKRHMCPSEIADDLNTRGIPYRGTKPWRPYTVERILTNAKYAGCNVWNRTSRKLGTGQVNNSRQQWIAKAGAFVPIIDQATFDRVQARLVRNKRRWSSQELLDELRRLIAKHGTVSEKLIAKTPGTASVATYYRHFGGFRRIYKMVGFSGKPGAFNKCDQRKRTLLLRDDVVSRLLSLFPQRLAVFHNVRDMRPIVRLDTGVRVAVRLCRRKQTIGRPRWRFYRGMSDQTGDAVLVCLLNRKNDALFRYYLLPHIQIPGKECTLEANDPLLASGFRLEDLAQFYVAANIFRKSALPPKGGSLAA